VSFSDNADFDSQVSRNGAVIAAYGTRGDRPSFPFWPMLFDNTVVRLLGSDDFPSAAKQQAASDLTEAAAQGSLAIRVARTLPLEEIATAHDLVDEGIRGRVLVSVAD
jgi:NADPH2:quinone reductase